MHSRWRLPARKRPEREGGLWSACDRPHRAIPVREGIAAGDRSGGARHRVAHDTSGAPPPAVVHVAGLDEFARLLVEQAPLAVDQHHPLLTGRGSHRLLPPLTGWRPSGSRGAHGGRRLNH
eukprot:1739236-Alexandrium_andersonii.AAC.1